MEMVVYECCCCLLLLYTIAVTHSSHTATVLQVQVDVVGCGKCC